MVSAAFDQLVAEFYSAWFRFRPDQAVAVGQKAFAGQLPPIHDDDIGALVSLYERLLVGLEQLDQAGLSQDQRLDYALLHGQAQIELNALLEGDPRKFYPRWYLPVVHLQLLALLDLPDQLAAVGRLCAELPERLRAARLYLQQGQETMPDLWREAARQEAMLVVDYLRNLAGHPQVRNTPVQQQIDAAVAAVNEFGQFLASLSLDSGVGAGCGLAQYERLLQHRHFIPWSLAQISGLVEHQFNLALEALQDHCRLWFGSEDYLGRLSQWRSEDSAPVKMLEGVRERLPQVKKRALDGGLAINGQLDGPVQLALMPPLWRYRFVGEHGLCAGDVRDCAAIVYLDARTLYNRTAQWDILAASLGWPGHRWQQLLACKKSGACTLPRRLNPSATLSAAWPAYAEQVMVEQGLLAEDEQRFWQLYRHMRRWLLARLDLEFHTLGASTQGVMDRLQTQLGCDQSLVFQRLAALSEYPGNALAEALGAFLINRLHSYVAENGQVPADFHKRLLAAGDCALPLVIKNQFGEDALTAVLALES